MMNTEDFQPKKIAVKICGMKQLENILEIASLQPSYLGFIFAKNSPRYFKGIIPHLPETIKKVGVFVADTIEGVLIKVQEYQLHTVQLHGNESVDFCQQLKLLLPSDVQIIKVFSVGTDFNFEKLNAFESYCDFFLLDTKGKFPGGNGTQFDWQLLKNYTSQKPFFLSGGIGVEDIKEIQQLANTDLPLHAIDCNSKFEIEVGIKSKQQCEELLENFLIK